MNYDEEPSPVCHNCAALAKQLAGTKAELAYLLAGADADAFMLTQVGRERDALAARVAQLEGALEPTALALLVLGAWQNWTPDSKYLGLLMQDDGHRARVSNRIASAIRARAGLDGKEGSRG